MKRSPIKARRSRRIAKRDGGLAYAREEVQRRSGGQCEVRLPGCQGRATVVHHRRLRSQGGDNTLVNLLHLCDADHRAIHADPLLSYISGFLVKSYQEPGDVAVDLRAEAWHAVAQP